MPGRARTLIARGEVWEADIPGVGRHPVVVATRDSALPLLGSVVCVLVTNRFRGHVAEIGLARTKDSIIGAPPTATTCSPCPAGSWCGAGVAWEAPSCRNSTAP